MGQFERWDHAEQNRARRERRPMGNWPRRLGAALLLLAGTTAAVAITNAMAREMLQFKSMALSGPFPRSVAMGAGLVALCILSSWNAWVVTGPNDARVFGWTRELPVSAHLGDIIASLLAVAFAAALGAGATYLVSSPRADDALFGRAMVIGVFTVFACMPLVSGFDTCFRVTRRMRVWKRRGRLPKAIAAELNRLDKRYEYRRWMSMIGTGACALFFCSVVMYLIAEVGVIGAKKGSASLFVIVERFLVAGLLIAFCSWIAENARRHYQRKLPFRPKNGTVLLVRLGFIGLFGAISASIIALVSYGLGYACGWPIGAVVSVIFAVASFLPAQAFLIKETGHFIDQQEKDESQQANLRDSKRRRRVEAQPTRSADRESVDELFSRPNESIAAGDDEIKGS